MLSLIQKNHKIIQELIVQHEFIENNDLIEKLFYVIENYLMNSISDIYKKLSEIHLF